MIERTYKLFGLPVIFLSFVVFFTSCATLPTGEDRDAALKATAETYWKLRMDDKYEDTYKIEDTIGLPPFEKYREKASAMKRIKIESISVKDVHVSGDKGVVDLNWSYFLPKIPKPFHQIIGDNWIFRDGKWLHELK